MVNYREYIVVDSTIRFGRPCIINTRIAVEDILGWLAIGMSIEEIIIDFPELNKEKILASIGYVADRERKVRIIAV